MPTKIVTEAVPPELLQDLREGLAHANKLLDQARELQQQANHVRGMAAGAKAEVERFAARKLQAGEQDVLDVEKGTITRVLNVAEQSPVDPPTNPSNTENPDGT